MRDQLKDRCNKIEECYEFTLAYAAQGLRTEPGSGTASQVRTLLTRADEALTQTLKSALALIDVRVLDHVIVTQGDSLSMAEKGLI